MEYARCTDEQSTKLNGLPNMDVKNGNRRPRCSIRSDLAAALSDPKRVMHKMKAGSQSYETAKLHNSDGIDIDTTAAFCYWISAAIVVQKAQEGQVTVTKLVEGENKAMKSDFLLGQSTWDFRSKIATVLAVSSVVTRAEDTEIVEFGMDKIHDKMKVELVETVWTRLKTLFKRVILTPMRDANRQCSTSLNRL